MDNTASYTLITGKEGKLSIGSTLKWRNESVPKKILYLLVCIILSFGIISSGKAQAESAGIKAVEVGYIIDENENWFEATYILYDNGELWFSKNDDFNKNNASNTSFVKFMDNVKQVYTGEGVTFAIKENGDLFIWGSIGSNDDELGLGFTESDNGMNPKMIMQNVEYVSYDSDLYFTDNNTSISGANIFALKSDGSLYAVSELAKTLVGATNSSTPVKFMSNVSYLDKFLFIRDNGELWSWGPTDQGQVGDGNFNDYYDDYASGLLYVSNAERFVTSPKLIMKDVRYVSQQDSKQGLPSGITSMAIKFDGSLWTWGYSVNQQIGIPNNTHTGYKLNAGQLALIVPTPEKIAKKIKYVDGPYVISSDDILWDYSTDVPTKIMEDVAYVKYVKSDQTRNRYGYYIKSNGELWRFEGTSYEKVLDGGSPHPSIDPVGDKLFRNASIWAMPDLRNASDNRLTQPVQKLIFTENINREQFCEVAVQLYEKMTGSTAPTVSKNPFNDTTNAEVLKAYGLGIVNGVSPTKFAPNDLITREQLASMMMRALNASGKKIAEGVPKDFVDKRMFSSYAVDSINFMSSINVIKGITEDSFGPRQHATIEQAVIMAERLLERI